MKKKIPIFLFCIFANWQLSTFAQDSSHLRVSLLTCGPGGPDDELYTTFGHTGVRITDSSTAYDWVYNYGTFDAFEDNFYLISSRGGYVIMLLLRSLKIFLKNTVPPTEALQSRFCILPQKKISSTTIPEQ